MKKFVVPAPGAAPSPEQKHALNIIDAARVKLDAARLKPFVMPKPKPPPKTPDSVRQAKAKAELLKAGGKRLCVNLPAESLADIDKITDRAGINTATEAIIAALHHFARCKVNVDKKRRVR